MWGTLLGGIGSIFKGVKSLVTTDKDRLDAVERMAKLDNSFGVKELDYKIELAKSGNWFTKSVRPMIAYTFLEPLFLLLPVLPNVFQWC